MPFTTRDVFFAIVNVLLIGTLTVNSYLTYERMQSQERLTGALQLFNTLKARKD